MRKSLAILFLICSFQSIAQDSRNFKITFNNPQARTLDVLSIRYHSLFISSSDQRVDLNGNLETQSIHLNLEEDALIHLSGSLRETFFIEPGEALEILLISDEFGYDSLVLNHDFQFKLDILDSLNSIEDEHLEEFWKEGTSISSIDNSAFLESIDQLYHKQTEYLKGTQVSNNYRSYLGILNLTTKLEYLFKRKELAESKALLQAVNSFQEVLLDKPEVYMSDRRINDLAYKIFLKKIESGIGSSYDYFWYNKTTDILKGLKKQVKRYSSHRGFLEYMLPNLIIDVLHSHSIDVGFELFASYGKEYPQSTFNDFLEDELDSYDHLRNGRSIEDISFIKADGSSLSLSELSDKIIFIDFWATWCSPCLQEIPYLNELKEEFNSYDQIIWLSVSVDHEKDKDKWLRFIEKYDMAGIVNVMPVSKKELNDYFRIISIPRYSIIDKGQIIFNAHAPRPPTTEIRDQLKSLLSK